MRHAVHALPTPPPHTHTHTHRFLLIIAATAQRQGGDVQWLQPYWPALQQWYQFLITLLPFPQEQLSTDDFDGPLNNATNLAIKGVAAIAAYGYIYEQYTGNASGAAASYALAADYSNTMMQYAWVGAGADQHFMLGYLGSKGDCGNTSSWPMIYNALWLRLLGFNELLPNQAAVLAQQAAWYEANVMGVYGVPLNSRKSYTKDDWMTFLAATFYDSSPVPQPSSISASLLSKFYNWANVTTSREPLSDWINTDQATAVGFTARPVLGAMYAPVLVQQGPQLGLGRADDPALIRANAVFRRVHAERAAPSED